jgi:hypothetical protein
MLGNGRCFHPGLVRDLRHTVKSRHQCCQTRAVFHSQGGEFQSQSVSGPYVSDNSLGSDLAFLNEKVKSNRRVRSTHFCCFDKLACRAQVLDSCSILASFAIPVDPDSVGRLDSRVVSPRRNILARQEPSIDANVLPPDHVTLPCFLALGRIALPQWRSRRFRCAGSKRPFLQTGRQSEEK